MPAYIIVFELKRRQKTYIDLDERLAKFDNRWQVRDSVWIVITERASGDLHSELRPVLGADDELFVARIDDDNSWSGYSQRVTAWLSNHLSDRT